MAIAKTESLGPSRILGFGVGFPAVCQAVLTRATSALTLAPMPITVSIVEDNEQLRGTLARVISRADGFKCLSQYGDAESALEGIPKERPEVVLMDINLPGM